LTDVAGRLPKSQMILRISGRGRNMPACVENMTPEEMDAIVAFLQGRKTQRP
jgi:hypothetical protein